MESDESHMAREGGVDKRTAKRQAHQIVSDLIVNHLLAADVEPFGDTPAEEEVISAALSEIARRHLLLGGPRRV